MNRRGIALVAAVAALAGLAAAGAPIFSGVARAGVAYPKTFAATDDAAAPRAATTGKDVVHRLQIVANLRATPPEQPLVILLGGSAAREATIDDQNWAAQILRQGGPHVIAYNLGHKHDTFELDREAAELLPEGLSAIVYIGINLGRFCNSPSDPVLTLPDPQIPPAAYFQHVYSTAKGIQSASRKRYYVQYWLKKRRPAFNAHYASNIRVLDGLVLTLQGKGLHPVLVDLPRDLPIIGRSFEKQVATYKAGCKLVAAKYRIPWLTFVSSANLADRDFYDIFHLVEPGRVKYQHLLSENTVRLLAKYGIEDPEPTPTPTPSPSDSATPAP